MPNAPVTMADRLGAIGVAAIMALVVFGVAYAVHRAISKDSPRKRIQGQPIVWWVSPMLFLGSCFGAWMADNSRYYLHEVVGGTGGFGLLVGLLVGNIHGFINLYRSRVPPQQPLGFDTQKETLHAVDTSNPYSPPSTQIDSALPCTLVDEARKFTWWPGVLMIVQGAIILSVLTIVLVGLALRSVPEPALPQFLFLFPCALALLLIWCGIQLKRIESRRLSYVGAALSVFLFLPIGWAICLWAIHALNRPIVREAFRVRRLPHKR